MRTGPEVLHLGKQPYQPVWQRMQHFTDHRNSDTADQLWIVEHPPIFTLGQAGKPEHILNAGDIPVVKTDRGGQVTYHGPGQLIVYCLIDCRRRKLGVRQLVHGMEQAVIDVLTTFGIQGNTRHDAPGVYVNDAKIAALGLRIRRGCSYHGLSLNVDMDLEPFSRINPCGFPGLPVTRLSDFGIDKSLTEIAGLLTHSLRMRLE